MKAKVKDNGEIIDVRYNEEYGCWIDINSNIRRAYYEKDLFFLEEMDANWNETLYETAKSVLNAIMSNPEYYNVYGTPPYELADNAIRYASALIDRLKQQK